jgi:glyoxylase-like metal-dependent hydrolase (beta-lactamase superfamily II)
VTACRALSLARGWSTLALTLGVVCWTIRPVQTQQPNLDRVQIHVEHIRGSIYLLAGAGGNITAQIGPDGVLLVDTEFAELAPKIVAELRKLSTGPIRFIVNTHVHPDHVGGNAAIAKLAMPTPATPLKIIAHENVLNRLTAPGSEPFPEEGKPVDEYYTPNKNVHFNDEAVIVYHESNAHTDGDSIVLFRGSDVLSVGDIFTPGAYPFIDIERGGSVKGEIAALNHILELTVPAHTQEGGTYVVPGHGRISDSADVVEFRDMVVIVRDRIQDLIKKGMTLDQVKAARPTRDYDPEYISATSFVKTDQFVEAMYKSLGSK